MPSSDFNAMSAGTAKAECSLLVMVYHESSIVSTEFTSCFSEVVESVVI